MSSPLPIDPGLLARMRSAAEGIVWTDVGPVRRSDRRKLRTAYLHDETARVEMHERPGATSVAVTSGPVGALVLLLEIDRRGPPRLLGARNAGADVAFPDGSIVAVWGTEEARVDSQPRLRDLVDLARYALR